MKKNISFLLLIIMLFLPDSLSYAATFDFTCSPGDNFNMAGFRLWFEDTGQPLQGVLVLMPGSNGDGRSEVTDDEWQSFAVVHHFALLGCYITDHPHDNMAIEEYAEVSRGSGQALLDAIDSLAFRSGHRELSVAPLLLWGFSAGGEFNYEFACWKPERVIGFVVNKGGVYYTALAGIQTRNVPGIFFTGDRDIPYRTNIVNGIFSINRRFGANWTYVSEPGSSHEVGFSKSLSIHFFEAILPLRMPGIGDTAVDYRSLRKIDGSAGCTGYLSSGTLSNRWH